MTTRKEDKHMSQPDIIPMRIDGLDAADLTRMLERNHARARIRRRQKHLAMRTRIIRIAATVIVVGSLMALAAW